MLQLPSPGSHGARSSEARRLTRLPLHPVLFAAYAVLFLYAQNLTEVLLVDIGAPLARAVLGAAAALLVLALLYRSPERGAIVASALVVAFFAFGHVAGRARLGGLGRRSARGLARGDRGRCRLRGAGSVRLHA